MSLVAPVCMRHNHILEAFVGFVHWSPSHTRFFIFLPALQPVTVSSILRRFAYTCDVLQGFHWSQLNESGFTPSVRGCTHVISKSSPLFPNIWLTYKVGKGHFLIRWYRTMGPLRSCQAGVVEWGLCFLPAMECHWGIAACWSQRIPN